MSALKTDIEGRTSEDAERHGHPQIQQSGLRRTHPCRLVGYRVNCGFPFSAVVKFMSKFKPLPGRHWGLTICNKSKGSPGLLTVCHAVTVQLPSCGEAEHMPRPAMTHPITLCKAHSPCSLIPVSHSVCLSVCQVMAMALLAPFISHPKFPQNAYI